MYVFFSEMPITILKHVAEDLCRTLHFIKSSTEKTFIQGWRSDNINNLYCFIKGILNFITGTF